MGSVQRGIFTGRQSQNSKLQRARICDANDLDIQRPMSWSVDIYGMCEVYEWPKKRRFC
jgi:hypothetical protein